MIFDLNSAEETINEDNASLTDNKPIKAAVASRAEQQPTQDLEHIDSENIDQQEEPDLDVGLDDFPDVLGDVNAFDVDINAEMNSNLDLAKVFLEMGDERTAIKLLKTVISKGDEALQAEANKLLSSI